MPKLTLNADALQMVAQQADPAHNRIVFHVHPKKTMGPKLLRGLLATIDWNEPDLARLGLVKVRGKRLKPAPPPLGEACSDG